MSFAREAPAAADVDAHPDAASPFGVLDLVGNVYQWTDESCDEHTCTAASSVSLARASYRTRDLCLIPCFGCSQTGPRDCRGLTHHTVLAYVCATA